jgi:hypothetical protein
VHGLQAFLRSSYFCHSADELRKELSIPKDIFAEALYAFIHHGVWRHLTAIIHHDDFEAIAGVVQAGKRLKTGR